MMRHAVVVLDNWVRRYREDLPMLDHAHGDGAGARCVWFGGASASQSLPSGGSPTWRKIQDVLLSLRAHCACLRSTWGAIVYDEGWRGSVHSILL